MAFGPIGALSLIEVIMLPPLILIVSGLSLANFKNVMIAVHNVATQKQTNAVLKQLRPAARPVRTVLEHLFGKAKSFSWTFTDVLLCGVIIALCGVINTQLRLIQQGKEREEKRAAKAKVQ